MSSLQHVIHARMEKAKRYMPNDEYAWGFVDGLIYALHRIAESEGKADTGCVDCDRLITRNLEEESRYAKEDRKP